MKLSLLLPVAIRANDHVRARMLVECLESIRQQTHKDYEIIIKDAYPGESVKWHSNVAKIMWEMRDKINYIAIADKNVTDGLNQAMWWANGDIFHIVCGDDLTSPNDSFEFVNTKFMEKEFVTPAWLYGSMGTVMEDGSEGHWGVTPFATLEEILIHNRMGSAATYWNRAMFERLGYFEYVLASDYDYWCRCYRVCPPMYTTRLLATGRRWSQSISHVNADFVNKEASEISAKHTAAHTRKEKLETVPYSS